MLDYIFNGRGHGSVADILLANNMNVDALRPYIGDDGRSYMNVVQNGELVAVPLTNAVASLRRDDWLMIDDVVMKAAKPRLRVFGDLRAANQMTLPNGMGTTSILYETMGDITPATISMDALRQSEEDRPEFDHKLLPLPIIHKDFSFTARQIAVARAGGTPLDTTTAELAGRRVAEEAEKLALGISGTFSYGGGTIYGYTNFPQRNTKALTLPTAVGWTPATLIGEILDMIQLANNDHFYGPFVLYFSPQWNRWLDDDYSGTKGDNTLRQRVQAIDGISGIRQADYLTGYQIIMVQMTSDVARAIVGMDITTVQWETHGGMRQHFKVMAIMVPQVRADADGQCGIVHGVAA